MDLIKRLRSDKKILFASILLLVSILSGIIYECMISIVHDGFFYVGSIVGTMIFMIPKVLFLIHTLVFYKTKKPQKLFTISYIVLLAYNSISLLQGATVVTLISNILYFLSHGLMVYLSLRGAKNRKLSLVGTAIPFVSIVISFIQMLSYLSFATSYWGVEYLWRNLVSYLGIFTLYVALFIIAPDTIIIRQDLELVQSNLLEEQLVTLKQRYDNGDITEQEYNDKKKEILDSL